MNFVVLTAALSSLNAGLYSTGRILRSMSVSGSAPRFTGVMNSSGVPYGGILLTGAITLLGVGLNAVVPEQAFEIVLNISALGIVAGWAMITLCQMQLHRLAKQGKMTRPDFRLFGAPFTAYLTLAFLAAVLVLMAIDYPVGTITIASLVVIVPLLVLGWFLSRGRILAIARDREGFTGTHPVVAERPGIDSHKNDPPARA
jgi:L-asparagine permease